MIPLLYPENATQFGSYSSSANPICALADCVSCTVTEERNGIYECEFKYPVNGQSFAEIRPGRIVYVNHDPSGDEQPFDIYAMEFDLDGLATFRASHISRRIKKIVFGDIKLESHMYGMPATINDVGYHRRRSKPIYGEYNFNNNGYNRPSDANADRKDKQLITVNDYHFTSLWDVVLGRSDSVANQAEAEMQWSWQTASFCKNRGTMTTAKIVYRSNMKSMRYEYDISGQCDAVIPYWIDPQTRVHYLLPDLNSEDRSYPYPAIAAPFIYDTIYVDNGRFTAVPVDFSSRFDEQPSADDLFDAATEYYYSNAISRPYENLTVEFAPLWDSTEYKYISDAEKIKLCDIVTVVFPEYGLVKPMKLVKATWDCLLERFTAMEFGSTQRTIYNVDAPGNTLQAETDTTYVDGGTDIELDAGTEIGE